jgi:uncharacterized membrane protein
VVQPPAVTRDFAALSISKKPLTNLLIANLVLGILNLVLSALVYFGKQDTDLALILLRLTMSVRLLAWINFLVTRLVHKCAKEKK